MALIDQANIMQGGLPQSQEGMMQSPPGVLEPEAAPEEDAGGPGITPEKVAQMSEALKAKVPPKLKAPYEKIVEAGKTVMYAEKSTNMVKAELERKAPIDQKLAHAALGLVTVLEKQSKGTMPPDAALLAGACLLLEMVDLVLRIGTPVNEQDVRDALDSYVTLAMMKVGANEKEIFGALGQPGPKTETAVPGDPPNLQSPGAEANVQPGLPSGQAGVPL